MAAKTELRKSAVLPVHMANFPAGRMLANPGGAPQVVSGGFFGTPPTDFGLYFGSNGVNTAYPFASFDFFRLTL